MKKTRFLWAVLAAVACALSIPACGGGGDDSGNTYISVHQFAGGGKAFKIFGVPSMRVYAFGGGGSAMSKDQADNILNGSGYGPSAPEYTASPQGAYEGKLNLTGAMAFEDGTTVQATLSYGTYGGETGTGVLEILPQSGFDNSTGHETEQMIHFLGGVTRNDMNVSGTNLSGTVLQLNSDYPRYLLFSLAGCSYRVVMDFSSGTLEFFLTYASSFEYAALGSSGQVLEGYHVTYNEIIDALNTKKNFIAEPR